VLGEFQRRLAVMWVGLRADAGADV